MILGKKEIRVKNHVWEKLKWGLSSNGENVVCTYVGKESVGCFVRQLIQKLQLIGN